jgi:hypothetical protein
MVNTKNVPLGETNQGDKLGNKRIAWQFWRVCHNLPLTINQGNYNNQGSLEILHPITSACRNYVGLHVRCPLLSDINQNWNMSTNFSKTSKYQVSQKNPFSRSRLVSCVWTKTDGQTNGEILIGAAQGCERVYKQEGLWGRYRR